MAFFTLWSGLMRMWLISTSSVVCVGGHQVLIDFQVMLGLVVQQVQQPHWRHIELCDVLQCSKLKKVSIAFQGPQNLCGPKQL